MAKFSNEELFEMHLNQALSKKHLHYVNHTQAVERGIKDVTFIAKQHPPEDRDAVMQIISRSRKKMPKFDTKKDFNIFTKSVSSEESNFEDEDQEDEDQDEVEHDVVDHDMVDQDVVDKDVADHDDGLITDSDSDMN